MTTVCRLEILLGILKFLKRKTKVFDCLENFVSNKRNMFFSQICNYFIYYLINHLLINYYPLIKIMSLCLDIEYFNVPVSTQVPGCETSLDLDK